MEETQPPMMDRLTRCMGTCMHACMLVRAHTRQIWGRDQLPRFFHEQDAEERALREELEAATAAAAAAAKAEAAPNQENQEIPAPSEVFPKRAASLPAKGNLGVCVRPAYGPWTSASHLVQVGRSVGLPACLSLRGWMDGINGWMDGTCAKTSCAPVY